MNDKLQELKQSIDQMKLKKVMFGGYDKKDVQMKFDMALAMFQKCMKDQENKEKAMVMAYEKQIEEMKALQAEIENKKRASDRLIADLNKNISELTEENQMMVQEQYKIKESYKAYCSEIIKQYSNSLRSLSGEFSRILENVSSLQKEINEESIIEGLEKALEVEE